MPQANIILNLLRTTRANPKLLAHACAHGNFNFYATPMALPRTKVIVHTNLTKRASYDLNSEWLACRLLHKALQMCLVLCSQDKSAC